MCIVSMCWEYFHERHREYPGETLRRTTGKGPASRLGPGRPDARGRWYHGDAVNHRFSVWPGTSHLKALTRLLAGIGVSTPLSQRTGSVATVCRSIRGRWGFGSTSARGAVSSSQVSYTHLRAHVTVLDLVCRLLLEKKNKNNNKQKNKNVTS